MEPEVGHVWDKALLLAMPSSFGAVPAALFAAGDARARTFLASGVFERQFRAHPHRKSFPTSPCRPPIQPGILRSQVRFANVLRFLPFA